jgi:phenolic acid decarboxylase
MDNPLVGRTFQWTWEQGFSIQPTFEVTFISNTQKTSKAIAGIEYAATHTYDLAIIAPDIYLLSWLEEGGAVITMSLNLNKMQVIGSFSTIVPERFFMMGTIKEISD